MLKEFLSQLSFPSKEFGVAIPEKPKPLIYTCPKTGNKYECSLDVHVYRAYRATARSKQEEEQEARLGPLYRIVYCTNTWEIAVDRAKYLLKHGLYPENRIEFVRAEKEELIALKRGDIVITQINEPVG